MAERIDELLVGLGLDADKQSFQEGMSMFKGLRGAAMSFLGVVGAGVGATALRGFASDLDVAGRNAERLGVSIGYMTQLGDAMAMAGGNAGAANAEISNMARLLDEFRYNTGGDAFSLAGAVGLDPRGIADAENAMDAYSILISQLDDMNAQERRVAIGSLGFGNETEFLAQAGAGQMQEWMQSSQQLADRTDEMVQQAREFNQELTQLNVGIRGLRDAILVEMMPELKSFIESVNKWIGEDGNIEKAVELISDGPEAIGRRGGDAVRESVSNWASDMWNSRDTPMRQQELMMEALARVESGGMHRDENGNLTTNPSSGARGKYQIMPATGRDPGYGISPLANDSEEEHRRFATEYMGALLEQFDGDIEKALAAYNWGPGNVQSAGDNWRNMAPDETRNYVPNVMEQYDTLNRQSLEAIQQRQQNGEFTPQDNEYLRQQFRQEFSQPLGNITIEVNGATSPEETARAVRREMQLLSERTINDFRNPVV